MVNPRLPAAGSAPCSGDELWPRRRWPGREAEATVPFAGGELARVAVPVRDAGGRGAGRRRRLDLHARWRWPRRRARCRSATTKYRKAESFKEPIKAVYLSLYLFPALLILFGAVWLSLYLARRITTPLRLVAEGAERIASGERGVRVDFPSGDDEFAALIASFNRMSERLARSEEEVEHTRAGLTRKNEELEERRRLMETVLETVGTGVVVVDAEGVDHRPQRRRLPACSTSTPIAVGRSLVGRPRRARAATRSSGSSQRLLSGRGARQEREVVVPGRGPRPPPRRHRGRRCPGPPGSPPGAVVVLDDLTPLMRAQKVAAWGEVARKLAHEIKNPLTPIQLSAQRVRKAYLQAAPPTSRRSSRECTERHRAPRWTRSRTWWTSSRSSRACPRPTSSPGSLHEVIEQTLSLYDGLFAGVTHRAAAGRGRARRCASTPTR